MVRIVPLLILAATLTVAPRVVHSEVTSASSKEQGSNATAEPPARNGANTNGHIFRIVGEVTLVPLGSAYLALIPAIVGMFGSHAFGASANSAEEMKGGAVGWVLGASVVSAVLTNGLTLISKERSFAGAWLGAAVGSVVGIALVPLLISDRWYRSETRNAARLYVGGAFVVMAPPIMNEVFIWKGKKRPSSEREPARISYWPFVGSASDGGIIGLAGSF